MENEKVIQITNTENGIFGLSTSGQLITFDKEAGSWVLRCQSKILTVDKLNTLVKAAPASEPQGRYRSEPQGAGVTIPKKEGHLWAIIITGAIVIGAGLVYSLLK